MGGKKQKKYQEGEALSLISRARALRKLQLSLADFRRLCILKGIYPVEPKNKKQAGRGNTRPTTYYIAKDIRFLGSEPVLAKFREQRIFSRKIRGALGRKDREKAKRLRKQVPQYTLNHLVKERYPSFPSALSDVDDALCTLSAFAHLCGTTIVRPDRIKQASRLIVEFQNYVILSQSLIKVFVSIKGYYYQANVCGQTVTWLAPHNFRQVIPRDVDLRVMSTFLEFYSTLVGFVNYRLYSTLNLRYPPRVSNFQSSGDSSQNHFAHLAALNSELERTIDAVKSGVNQPDGVELDEFPEQDPVEEAARLRAKQQLEESKSFKQLFAGCKIFLAREVPRDSLVFVIKSFAGRVSWDNTLGVGATFSDSDEDITHQIVDRPAVEPRFLTRYYVQPQWIFDSVNARRLLPPDRYFPGVTLPPHVSPFVQEGDQDGGYVPVDLLRLKGVSEDVIQRYQEELKKTPAEDEEESAPEEQSKEAELEGQMVTTPGTVQVETHSRSKGTKEMIIEQLPRKRKEYIQRLEAKQLEKEKEVKKLKAKRRKIESGK